MALIFAPGQRPIRISGQEGIGDLRNRGIIPENYSLVRKSGSGSVETLKENEPLQETEEILAVPRHLQGRE